MEGQHGDAGELDDRVSFGPTVTDTRRFTVGLWSTEVLLSALVLAGVLLRSSPEPLLRVGAACLDLVWLVASYAIVLRGRLQPMPRVDRRIVAVVACLALGSWAVAFAVSTTWPVAVIGLVIWMASLLMAYRARMFRWR